MKDAKQIQGEKAEQWVYSLATRTFLTDWCYLNPLKPDGKELCDLLVVFDNIAIIWQIKDLKLGKDGKYKKSEVEKNIRQLGGARRQLFDLKTPIPLSNPRRIEETFNTDSIEKVYLISVLLGEGEPYRTLVDKQKEDIVHVFTAPFIEIILNELDTISDFVQYLQEKEVLLQKDSSLMIMGGEEELLAYYMMNEKSFGSIPEADRILLDHEGWDHIKRNPKYIAKKEADRVSFGWDSIIDCAHTGSIEYERIARELARPNRFERRYLAKVYFEAHQEADQLDDPHLLFRRFLPADGVTYCFLFMEIINSEREPRRGMLMSICKVARNTFRNNHKVIGIATECKLGPECSYDFCLIDTSEWPEEQINEAEELQKQLGIMTNPRWQQTYENEYPEIK